MSMTSSAGSVVGFIGLGKIGGPLADRLLAAGFELVVHDIRAEAMAPFAGRAERAASCAEVGERTDIAFGCLQTAEDYRSAITGPNGLIEGRRVRTYAHIGTTGRESVIDLARALGARGVATVDAPMSGGVAAARDGRLVSMLAGPATAIDRMEPCVAAYSRRIVRLADAPGLAQAMKLFNNMLSAANLAVAVEIMVVGAKAGIPAETMLEVLNHGTGQNSATLTKIPDQIVPRSFAVGASLANALKDVSNYIDEAQALGVDSAFGEAVLARYRLAVDQGSAADDISTVIRPFERAAGVLVKRR